MFNIKHTESYIHLQQLFKSLVNNILKKQAHIAITTQTTNTIYTTHFPTSKTYFITYKIRHKRVQYNTNI